MILWSSGFPHSKMKLLHCELADVFLTLLIGLVNSSLLSRLKLLECGTPFCHSAHMHIFSFYAAWFMYVKNCHSERNHKNWSMKVWRTGGLICWVINGRIMPHSWTVKIREIWDVVDVMSTYIFWCKSSELQACKCEVYAGLISRNCKIPVDTHVYICTHT